MSDYTSVVIYLALIVGFAVFSLVAAWVLRPRRPFAAKLESYECGAEPIGSAWVQFPVGFYLVALVFIVFDALAVFLFPWVLTVRGLGLWGILSMVTFLAILSLGWVYAYRERILEWK
ncbi:MAG TPA: NADH-quinone oxidoreductase subunit A [Vicinamibacterales bacterium]|nr:NADH-quinone oxidoreductase subunit A [Vicinamibacterales bacterium]